MNNESIATLASGSRSTRHRLSDWLAVHELDSETCRRILDAMPQEAVCNPAEEKRLNLGYEAPDAEVAWLRIAEAMRQFLPEQQSIIDDTFEKTVKVVVDKGSKSAKALTLDNGPAAYPTILFSYSGEPSDFLVIAHEFSHALQIRASRGKFVPPITREICAFLGESALLSHALQCNAAQYDYLAEVWRENNSKYLGAQRNRLQAALSRPHTSYQYSWNYPLARYFAIQISERCSRDWIWSIFEGEISVREVLRELSFPPS